MMNDELGMKNMFGCKQRTVNYKEVSGLQRGNDEGGMMNDELRMKSVVV